MEDRNKIVIDYYNIITGGNAENIGDIPEDKAELITVQPTDSLIRPIVTHCKRNGQTVGQISQSYNMPYQTLRFYYEQS